MKIKIEKINLMATTKEIQLLIDFPVRLFKQVHELKRELEGASEINIERVKEKRSLDANALAWVLIRSLAEHLGISAMEVYRNTIQDMYTYNVVPIKDSEIENYIRRWESRGSGWICETLGACKNFEGYTNIKCYYGSSEFDTKEMSDFIDMLIQDCKACGIDTRTPDEIERAKQLWEK